MKIPFANRIKSTISRAKNRPSAVPADVARIRREEAYAKMLNAKARARNRRSYSGK